MTFKTAREAFETVLQIAESSDDSTMEHLAIGLIELTKALSSDATATKSKLDAIASKVSRLN